MKNIELSLNDLDSVSGGATGGSVLSSDSFRSDTGTGLNIRVDWSVVKDVTGEKTLEVQVSSLSYSLSSIEMPSGVEITVNGAVYHGKSAAVNYSGRSQIASPLASFSIPNLSGTVQLSVVWHFNGSYSGVALGDIRASGTAVV